MNLALSEQVSLLASEADEVHETLIAEAVPPPLHVSMLNLERVYRAGVARNALGLSSARDATDDTHAPARRESRSRMRERRRNRRRRRHIDDDGDGEEEEDEDAEGEHIEAGDRGGAEPDPPFDQAPGPDPAPGGDAIDTLFSFSETDELAAIESVRDMRPTAVVMPAAGTVDVRRLRGTAVYRQIAARVNALRTHYQLHESTRQDGFVETLLQTMLPIIYRQGNEWEKYACEITEYYGLSMHRKIAMLFCARQVGKTLITCMVVASLLSVVGGEICLLFSLSEQLSGDVRGRIERFLVHLKAPILTRNAKQLVMLPSVKSGEALAPSSLYTISGNDNAARGFPASLFIMDEGAFMAERVFTQGVAPHMNKPGTVCVIMSTPSTNESWATELKDRVHPVTKEPFVNTVAIGTRCKRCDESGAPVCTHTRYAADPWKDHDVDPEFVRALYGDNEAMRRREESGMMTAANTRVFLSEDVDVVAKRGRLPVDTVLPRLVLMAIDPSGGGAASHFAVVLVTLSNKAPYHVRVRFVGGGGRGGWAPGRSRRPRLCRRSVRAGSGHRVHTSSALRGARRGRRR